MGFTRKEPAFQRVLYAVNNIQDAYFPANVCDNTDDNVQSSESGSGDTGDLAEAVREQADNLVGTVVGTNARDLGEPILGANVQGIKSLTITGKAAPGKSEATAYTATATVTDSVTLTYAWTVSPG